jgi:Flp pilus assembly pilin Flp
MRRHLARGDKGASSVEYGLLAVAIAAVVTFVVYAMGIAVEGTYAETCTSFANQRNDPGACP